MSFLSYKSDWFFFTWYCFTQPQSSRTLWLPEEQSARRALWQPSWAVGSRPAVDGKTEQNLARAPGDGLRPGHRQVTSGPSKVLCHRQHALPGSLQKMGKRRPSHAVLSDTSTGQGELHCLKGPPQESLVAWWD